MAHTQKPDFVFRRNGRVHLNREGASIQSTTGSRGVRISGSNAGYTMFRGSVKWYWLPTPFTSFPFTSPPVRHRVPSHFNWTLLPEGYLIGVWVGRRVIPDDFGEQESFLTLAGFEPGQSTP